MLFQYSKGIGKISEIGDRIRHQVEQKREKRAKSVILVIRFKNSLEQSQDSLFFHESSVPDIRSMIRRDALWKGIIEDFFPEMMGWFYPDIHEDFDFSRVEFLDKELQEIIPDSESSNRRADKLIKVGLHSGEERWLLVHIEIQGYYDADFERRMFQYFYRIYDRYQIQIEPLVILTDRRATFHPEVFEIKGFRFNLSFRFFACKLMELSAEELLRAQNPFGIVLKTAWDAIHYRNASDELLLELKMGLFRNLLTAGYDKQTISRLLRFIRHYTSFSKPELNRQLEYNIIQLTDETMARGIIERVNEEYKRIAHEQGMEKGMEKGMEEGMEKGIEKGIEKGKFLMLEKVVNPLLKQGLSPEQIADLVEVPLNMIESIIASQSDINA